MKEENTDNRSEEFALEEPAEKSQVDLSAGMTNHPLIAFWNTLTHFGLGEASMRIGTAIISIVFILIAALVLKTVLSGMDQRSGEMKNSSETGLVALPTVESLNAGGLYSEYSLIDSFGIARLTEGHTIIPARPRTEVIKYTVVEGDTVFGIAQKFNLRPETILWGNYYVLIDDPHRLKPGQELNILPVDGVYYEWHQGDGLNGVSQGYGVSPEAIVSCPGNHLSMETVGDFAAPNIEPGTWIIVPGGTRGFVSWSAPRISRTNPAVAHQFGPGACEAVMDGPIGTGSYIFPTDNPYVSGYDFSPSTNHRAVDFGGQLGVPVYASDSGVVVYAGWNDYGYGNMVVVDHGSDWQTLYAHLSALNVACGSYVYQGDTIGFLGSTGNSSGPHLHFEIMSGAYGRVNPHDFLH